MSHINTIVPKPKVITVVVVRAKATSSNFMLSEKIRSIKNIKNGYAIAGIWEQPTEKSIGIAIAKTAEGSII